MAQQTVGQEYVNAARLEKKMAETGVDATIAVSPENTYYLSGVFIRTQISVRDRLALVVWPQSGEPTYIVCNIEESLARAQSPIKDIRTYVEFAESPVTTLAQVLRDKGLADKVRVSRSGCLDVCSEGPNVLLMPDNIWFKHVEEKDVEAIIKQAVHGI